jgi:glycosyltransferase involved in cell wall biosynthesis
MPVFTGGDVAPLLCRTDVLLTWAVADLADLIGDFPGRVVSISHGDGEWLRSRVASSWQRATDFVAVSREAAGAFPEEVRSRVVIQPAGVELDRIAPSRSRKAIREEWGVLPDQIAVGYVGRFSPEKNPLQVARIVGQLGGKFVAIYHGHNPWGEEKFKQDAQAAAGGRIRFIPQAAHTGDVYAGIDKLVQASSAEGGPLVAIEAWLANTQLVTTDVGVVSDDDELRAMSVIVSKDAGLDDWCHRVQNTIRWSTRDIPLEKYSAAAAARRWEEFLIGDAN